MENMGTVNNAEISPGLYRQPVVVDNTYLRRLYRTEKIILGATDGTETLRGSGVFLGGVYGLSAVFKPIRAPETIAAIFEITESGKFTDFFGFRERRRPWEESQVVAFCRDHRNRMSDDRRGYGFVTLFEMVGGLVVLVDMDTYKQFSAHVLHLGYDIMWHASFKHRVVMPE